MATTPPVMHIQVIPTIPDDYSLAISKQVAIATADVHLRIAAQLLDPVALHPDEGARVRTHLNEIFDILHPEAAGS